MFNRKFLRFCGKFTSHVSGDRLIYYTGDCRSTESRDESDQVLGTPAMGRCRPLSDGTRKVLEGFQSSVGSGSRS